MNARQLLLAALTAFCVSCGATVKYPVSPVLQCRIAVLKPHLGPAAKDVMQSMLRGEKPDVVSALAAAGVQPLELPEIYRRWQQCADRPFELDAGGST